MGGLSIGKVLVATPNDQAHNKSAEGARKLIVGVEVALGRENSKMSKW